MALRIQLRDLIEGRAEDKVGRPAEVLRLNILRRDRELEPVTLHRSDVPPARSPDGIGRANEVEVITPVDIGCNIDAVAEDAHIESEVQLVLLFVRQVFVLEVTDVVTVFRLACGRSPSGTAQDNRTRVRHPVRSYPYQRVRGLEGQV